MVEAGAAELVPFPLAGDLELSALPSVSAAGTPALEAEQIPSEVSVTPSKVLPFRVGHEFNLHRLELGYPLIIGGIDIPHEKGCEAHSDGDILLRCVVDAILGAFGLPDIGQIFLDSDPKWKGAASSVFIKEVLYQRWYMGFGCPLVVLQKVLIS
ncbi:2-C-methyl-D-erythritol 2,4-cyclodiphosphate synthase, chloroplastic-like [Humulus lupulus]|uniref:2-C-methyl-D-erythritol 2,4-cyclodiphosphate synthase, chloroplastic-like n=1 Tax=Humulus lupulus TaxID=3486 RepID=UPI002B4108E2|nr:2-C-methyl-D-erythritol 2,4-cyclodiphosphate synthase, chloroplastic-like [Humulus lupulus]